VKKSLVARYPSAPTPMRMPPGKDSSKNECDTRWVKNLATRVRVVALTCIRYQRCEAASKAITKLPRNFIGKVNKPGALVKSNRFPSVPLNLSLVNSNCCSDFLIGRLGIQGIFSSPSMGWAASLRSLIANSHANCD